MSSSPPVTHILIVEDESAIAELIAMTLAHSGWQVALARDGHAADLAIGKQLPDLIVLDWMLPGLSGLALARKWRAHAQTRDIPIIMLTGRADELDKVSALDAGADDYLTKPFSTQELQARIRAVLRRRAPSVVGEGEQLRLGELSLDTQSQRVHYQGAALKLAPLEFKLLQCLLQAPERVHSRASLLTKVWGDEVLIEERTVDVHIKRLRQALGGAGAMIETVRGSGYRMSAKPTIETT